MNRMTSIGFTGTRGDITAWQKKMIIALLRHHLAIGFTNFHHGDCVGADEFAAVYALDVGYRVVCHPPVNEERRAFTFYHEICPAKSYLERNTMIVNAAHIGLAVPDSELPKSRSGTWSTVTKMANANLPRWVITPTTFWASIPTTAPSLKGQSVDH